MSVADSSPVVKKNRGEGFNLKDNVQEGDVRSISSDSERSDLGRIKPYNPGSKGYPSQALNNFI